MVTESITRKRDITDVPTVTKIKADESYETDGVFCSFNCTLAFALENRSNPLYSRSVSLINRIYNDMSENGNTPLTPSPSWRLLEEYGGQLSIDEYRKNLYRITYEDRGIQRPIFNPVAMVYEEKYKL